jgi:hypothetical protein
MMSVEQWVSVIGLGLALIGFVVRVERRMGGALTREEHDEICKERNARVEKQLDDLRDDIECRHEENRETLSEIRNSITGTHQRLDAFLLRIKP